MTPCRSILACCVFLLLWWLPGQAAALTTCSVTQSPSLTFGQVSATGTTEVQGSFRVQCNTLALSLLAHARVRMCLSIGDGASGGGHFNPRRLLNTTSDPLDFQIYQDSGHSVIWGSRGNATVPNPVRADFDYPVPLLVGGSQEQTFFLYGRIPAQSMAMGSYGNSFTGIHTRIEFQYNEQLLGTPPFPASCVSGGTTGTSIGFPFNATAAVPPSCRAYATTDLDFGSVPGIVSRDVEQTSTIGLTCTGRTAWHIGLNNGLNASGNTRRMRLGSTANYVAYELYRDDGRTQRWGNTLNTDTREGSGDGGAQTVTVFGRVPAPQAVPAGDYSDTITVTISY